MHMDIFERKKIVENKITEPPGPTEEERAQKTAKAATEMIKNEHFLAQKLNDPYWIKKALEKTGQESKKTLKENLAVAIKVLSDETGYDFVLIKEIYNQLQQKE